MHVFIGGAYNGKEQFVKDWLDEKNIVNVKWFSGKLPTTLQEGQIVVIQKLEQILQHQDFTDEVTLANSIFTQITSFAEHHHVIIILTDMGRGIVPIDKEQRQLRDVCGRLYQLLFKESNQVTRIWYGLSERLK